MTVLFADYPARPEDVVRSADTLTARADEVRAVARDVVAAVGKARIHTAGSLPELIDALASPPLAIGDRLHEDGTFAASVLHAWALAVALYDGGCAVLNTEFDIAVARGFGVPEPRTGEHVDPSAAAAYDGAMASARAAKVAELTSKHAALEGALDDTARRLASLLDEGPTARGWGTLGSLGPVPAEYAPPPPSVPSGGGDDPAITALTLLLGDPRVCIGDNANIPECVLELASLVGPLKALKIGKVLKALDKPDDLDDAKDAKNAVEAAARRADHLRKNPPESIRIGDRELPGVPRGARGTLAKNRKGLIYDLDEIPADFDRRVKKIRIMDPKLHDEYSYPNGYSSYLNELDQVIDPFTGRTIRKDNPLWHMPLD